MRGQIIRYSFQTGTGAITGDDGNRYTFDNGEWRENYAPAQDMRVDFDDYIYPDGQGRQALEVHAVSESPVPTTTQNATQGTQNTNTKPSKGMKWWHWTLIGVGAFFALLIVVGMVVEEEPDTTEVVVKQTTATVSTSVPAPVPTAIPTPDTISTHIYTARELHDLNAKNAEFFASQFKGGRIHVTGWFHSIIDDREYVLAADPDTGIFITQTRLFGVILEDLSKEEQGSLSIGNKVLATCKVGDYITEESEGFTVSKLYMDDCSLGKN